MKKMRPTDCSVDDYSSDDEISVGCPSPQHQAGDRMDQEMEDEPKSETKETVVTSQRIRPEDTLAETSSDATKNASAGSGVRSFSILDILNHRPAAAQPTQQRSTPAPESSPACSAAKIRRKSSNSEAVESPHHHPPNVVLPSDVDSPTKIMRPWDYPHLTLPAHFQAAAAAAAGFLNPNRCLPFGHPASSPFLAGPHPFGLQSHPAAGLGYHPHHHHHANFHAHHHHQRVAGSSFAAGILSVGGSSSGHLSPSISSSPDYASPCGSSDCDGDDVCSTSGNSATSAGSPLLQQQQRQKTLLNSGSLVVNNNNNNNSSNTGSVRKSSSSAVNSSVKKSSADSGKGSGVGTNSAGGTPLDALFQMTSKTFDGSSNNGADSSGKCTTLSWIFFPPAFASRLSLLWCGELEILRKNEIEKMERKPKFGCWAKSRPCEAKMLLEFRQGLANGL